MPTVIHAAESRLDAICYKNNFLKEVIVRIDFPVPIESLQATMPAKLANALAVKFPIQEPMSAISQRLQIGEKGVMPEEPHRFTQWNFFGKDREKQLAISAQYIFVTYKAYATFESMLDEFTYLVNTLRQIYPDMSASRLGLRYVNTIDSLQIEAPTKWDKFIKAELLGSFAAFVDDYPTTRAIQLIEFRFEDEEIEVRFQYGMPNPDYPGLIRSPQFILDIDSYVRVTHSLAESLNYLEPMHRHVQELFEKSITDELRAAMDE